MLFGRHLEALAASFEFFRAREGFGTLNASELRCQAIRHRYVGQFAGELFPEHIIRPLLLEDTFGLGRHVLRLRFSSHEVFAF